MVFVLYTDPPGVFHENAQEQRVGPGHRRSAEKRVGHELPAEEDALQRVIWRVPGGSDPMVLAKPRGVSIRLAARLLAPG